MGCVVSGSPLATLHHCHGGSMPRGISGMGLKSSDWLVIPLAVDFHTGQYGIDSGALSVDEWEQRYGRQVDHLDLVASTTGVDVWDRAGVAHPDEEA